MQDSTFLEMHMTQSHDTQQEPIPSGVRSISGAVHWGAKRKLCSGALPPTVLTEETLRSTDDLSRESPTNLLFADA